MTALNDRLRQLRKQRGLTQEQLAQRVNVSRQTVSHWENGRASPDYDMLHLLAEALDTTAAALLSADEGKDAASSDDAKENHVVWQTAGESEPVDGKAALPAGGDHGNGAAVCPSGGNHGSEATARPSIQTHTSTPAGQDASTPLPVGMRKWLPWLAAAVFLCLCLTAAGLLLRSYIAPTTGPMAEPVNTLTPEWFAQSSPRVEGSGWLDIVTYQSPVPRKKTSGPYQWEHSVFFREENGVATTIDQLDLWYFFADGGIRQESHPGDEIAWGSHSHSRIRAGGSREFILANASSQPIQGVGFQLTCTDEHGQSLIFRQFIPYSMEVEGP